MKWQTTISKEEGLARGGTIKAMLITGSNPDLTVIAQLLAYAARADGNISSEELTSLQSFLQQRYSNTEREELFSLFRKALSDRYSIDQIISRVQLKFASYRERLELFTSFFGLLLAGGLTLSEIQVLEHISSFLSLETRDYDLLVNATRERVFAFPTNIERFLLIAEESRKPDIAVNDLNIILMEFSEYYIAWSPTQAVRLADSIGFPGDFIFIDDKSKVDIGDRHFAYSDIDRLFLMSTEEVHRRIDLAAHPGFLSRIAEGETASLCIAIEGPSVRLEMYAPMPGLLVNGKSFMENGVVFPGTIIQFPGFGAIDVNDILDQIDNDRWTLSSENVSRFRYVISTRESSEKTHALKCPEGDTHIVISVDGLVPDRFLLQADASERAFLGCDSLVAGSTREINEETILRIGPDRYCLDPSRERIVHSSSYIDFFEVDDLGFLFGKTWGLRHVSFTAESGQLVAIMGASGSGKSTLLNILIGLSAPHEGKVLLNGLDFHENLICCKPLLGYVPQDDFLMENLTIEENLFFAGRIRLPELPADELRSRVHRVLRDINLLDKRSLQVGNPMRKVLSGGQRKRLNIGIELLADPDLFLLDEPTSGLSSRDSESIVILLKELTRKGKLVLIVIHQPSSSIFRMFDRLLILDSGGVQAWYGSAMEALGHFKSYLPGKRAFVECPACNSVNPEILFDAIEQKSGDSRRYDGIFWNNAYRLRKTGEEIQKKASGLLVPVPARRGIAEKFVSFSAGFKRSFIDRIRDKANILMSIFVPFLLALIMASMMRGLTKPYIWANNRNLQKYFFLSIIIYVFFGLMASVGEVIRDRPIIRREKVVHFSSVRYVLSKILAYAPFSIVQGAIYSIVSAIVLQMPWLPPAWIPIAPPLPFPLYFFIVAFVVIQASYALGLMASSFLKSQVAAFNLIPLVIIPQILLGGIFVEFASMPKVVNRKVPEYAQLSFSRWGYEALVAGEVALNPWMCVQPVAVLAYRKSLEAAGKSFDYSKNIDEPTQRWRALEAFPLPPGKISRSVFMDEILQQLKNHDRQNEVEKLEASYALADDGLTMGIKAGLPESDRAAIAGILIGKDTSWWASAYSVNAPNHALAQERIDAISDEGKKGLQGGAAWLVDWSDYPAAQRVIDGIALPSQVFNLVILAVMAFICHAVSALRLKYKHI